jgi:hypothetical protein
VRVLSDRAGGIAGRMDAIGSAVIFRWWRLVVSVMECEVRAALSWEATAGYKDRVWRYHAMLCAMAGRRDDDPRTFRRIYWDEWKKPHRY